MSWGEKRRKDGVCCVDVCKDKCIDVGECKQGEESLRKKEGCVV